MSLPDLPLIDRCIFIDNSMLELLNTCPRALEYSQLRRRVAIAESPALNFGSALHLALEFRYVTCANLPTDPLVDSQMARILNTFFEQHSCPVEDYRNYNWCLEVMKWYNQIHYQEEFSLLEYEKPQPCNKCQPHEPYHKELLYRPTCPWCNGSGQRKLMVELPFALPLCAHNMVTTEMRLWDGNMATLGEDEIGVFYSGKVDLPTLRDDNQIIVIDHKSTSLLGPGFWDALKMSAQQKGYAWSFQKLTGLPVRGYEVNAIRVKEPSQKCKAGGAKDVEKWWRESICRERFLLDKNELDEWHENVIDLVSELFWRHRRGYFAMKTNWCVGKYGRCSFYEVCSTQPKEDRLILLNSGLYKENTWSPLNQPSQAKQTIN